jgi:phage-related protein
LLKLLAERGDLLGQPRSKALGQGLFELRGKQVRIFYVFRSEQRIVLLDALIKKRSQIPRDTLDALRALQRVVK